MLFLGKRFEDLNEDDFNQLVLNSVRENRSLEYKVELPGGKESERKEFLSDISAIANTDGGFIFFGIEDKDGVANKISGIASTSSVDAVKLDIENRIRTGLQPRLIGLRIQEFPLANGNHIIGLFIPRSLHAPHMVTFQDYNKFYGRNSAGKHLLDVTELRDRFLLSADLPRRIQDWVDGRLKLISEGKGTYPIGSNTWLAMHLVPALSISNRYNLSTAELQKNTSFLRPFGTDSPKFRFNLDGIVAYPPVFDSKDAMGTYSQLFRTGQIESVAGSDRLQIREDGKITLVGFEHRLVSRAKFYLGLLELSDISPPISISTTFNGVKGMTFQTPRDWFPQDVADLDILQDCLSLPTLWIDEWEQAQNVELLMRPVIDALWNAAGFEGSPNYDDAGKWATKYQ